MPIRKGCSAAALAAEPAAKRQRPGATAAGRLKTFTYHDALVTKTELRSAVAAEKKRASSRGEALDWQLISAALTQFTEKPTHGFKTYRLRAKFADLFGEEALAALDGVAGEDTPSAGEDEE